MLQQNINVTMRRYETVRLEWDATFVEPPFDLIRRGLENAGSGNDHLKLALHSTQSG